MTDRVVNIALMNSNGISCIDISADDAKFRINIEMYDFKDDMEVLKKVLENGDETLCEFMIDVEEKKHPICLNGTDYSYNDYCKVFEEHNLGHIKTSLNESIEKDQQKTIRGLLDKIDVLEQNISKLNDKIDKIDVLEQKISNLDNKIFDLSGGNYGNNSCDY